MKISYPILLFLLSIVLITTTSHSTPVKITFTGATSSTTPEYMGIGQGNGLETSNYLQWMQYLNPTAVRYFATSVNDWKNFITSRSSSAWGASFANNPVTDQESWNAAVQHLRSVSSSPASPDFFDWLSTQSSTRWTQFVSILNTTNLGSPMLECLGNPTSILDGIKQLKARPLVVWHVTCSNFKLTSTDKASSDYWKERWELYRWFYLGGRFLSDKGVEDIELYNEPDKEDCLTPAFWIDEMSIRSQALQHAYADHSSKSGQAISPTLIAPPMSAPRYDSSGPLSYGQLAVKNRNLKFPTGNDPSWFNFKEFSYHQYNSPGYGMRSAYDNILTALNKDAKLPIRITEHNCYSASAADAVKEDVMNSPATAACLANQISAMINRPRWMSVQKFSQTYSKSGFNGKVNNGLFYADTGQLHGSDACNIGGSTKSGEAYRLLLRNTPGSKKTYAFTSTPPLPKLSNYSTYTVADNIAYYIYSINNQASPQPLTFDLSKLPGINAGATSIVTAVSSSLHGEQTNPVVVGAKKTLTFSQPGQSVYMLTVPRGNAKTKTLNAVKDTSVNASNPGSNEGGSAAQLSLSISSQDSPAVFLVAFNASNSIPNREKIVSAALQLTVASYSSPDEDSHSVTVYGITDTTWDEKSATWNSLSNILLSASASVRAVEQNVVNWRGISPQQVVGRGAVGDVVSVNHRGNSPQQVVGHGTAGAVGQVVSVDVTEYLKNGGEPSFLIARMVKFDQNPGGAILGDGSKLSFSSKESSENGKPVLHIIAAT